MTGKKLLIAEGGPTMQKVIRLVLANEGFDIHTAKNGVEALEALKTLVPDICILDAGLKELSAFDVKAKASENPALKNIQYILLTSAYEKVEENRIQAAGFQGHLVKPFDPSELREVIADVRSRVGGAAARMTPPPAGPSVIPAPPKAPPPMRPGSVPTGIPTPPPQRSAPPPQAAPVKFDPPSFEMPPLDLPEIESAGDPFPPTVPGKEGDIRDLTESTIRMSGLDDYQWNVQDPSLPPPPKSSDLGGMTFSLDDDQPVEPFASHAPESFSAENMGNENTDTIELDSSDIHAGIPPFEPSTYSPPPAFPSEGESNEQTDYSTSNYQGQIPNSDQIERIVRDQVEQIIRRMTERALPDLTEKIIREELKRLMEDPL